MSEKEIREMMLEMIRKMDAKLDEHSDTLARIETRMETFVTKEECAKSHLKPEVPDQSENITVTSGKKRIIIPLGIIAAVAAAVVTVIQALS